MVIEENGLFGKFAFVADVALTFLFARNACAAMRLTAALAAPVQAWSAQKRLLQWSRLARKACERKHHHRQWPRNAGGAALHGGAIPRRARLAAAQCGGRAQRPSRRAVGVFAAPAQGRRPAGSGEDCGGGVRRRAAFNSPADTSCRVAAAPNRDRG